MSKQSIIYDGTGAGTSATKVAQLRNSYLGLIQVKTSMSTVATITWTIQGRTTPDAAWTTITTITEADLPGVVLGTTYSIYKPINMLHEMQVIVTVGNAGTTHTTYLQEY